MGTGRMERVRQPVAGPTVLGAGSTYVLVEVMDGYQIWDRQDFFAATPRGCPRHYQPLTPDGKGAAWTSFFELEPAAELVDRST
jgi:hypothetical protein